MVNNVMRDGSSWICNQHKNTHKLCKGSPIVILDMKYLKTFPPKNSMLSIFLHWRPSWISDNVTPNYKQLNRQSSVRVIYKVTKFFSNYK